MDDSIILQKVSDLTEEERSRESHELEPLSKEKLARLRAIEIELDQCWELAAPTPCASQRRSRSDEKACDPKALSRATSSDSERLRP